MLLLLLGSFLCLNNCDGDWRWLGLNLLLLFDGGSWDRLGDLRSSRLLSRSLLDDRDNEGCREHCHVHHVGEVGLDLRLVDIKNFEAFLDKKLLAFDGLDSLCLPSIIGLHLAHEG